MVQYTWSSIRDLFAPLFSVDGKSLISLIDDRVKYYGELFRKGSDAQEFHAALSIAFNDSVKNRLPKIGLGARAKIADTSINHHVMLAILKMDTEHLTKLHNHIDIVSIK